MLALLPTREDTKNLCGIQAFRVLLLITFYYLLFILLEILNI